MRYILITILSFNTMYSYSQVGNNTEQTSNDRISTGRKVSAYMLSTIGGALVGIPIGQEIGQQAEAQWILAGAGVALITAAFPVAFGDDLSISVRAVRGNYKMERMKALLPGGYSEFEKLNLPYESIDSYPSSTGYEILFSGTFNRWELGTKLTLRSTQGRLENNDQNNLVKFEDNLTDWEITEFVRYNFVRDDKIKIAFGLNIGLGETINENIASYTQDNGFPGYGTGKTTFINIFLGPELSANYYLSDLIFLNALIGYDHHIVKRHMYTYGVGIQKEADWSGMRYGLGVGIKFLRN